MSNESRTANLYWSSYGCARLQVFCNSPSLGAEYEAAQFTHSFFAGSSAYTGAPSINGLGSRSSGGGGTAANPNVLVSNIHVSNNLKSAMVHSVEIEYQNMIRFTDDDRVTINIDQESLSNLMEYDSESNMAALATLTVLQTEIFVEGINRNQKMLQILPGGGSWDMSFNELAEYDFMNGPTSGIFLAPEPKMVPWYAAEENDLYNYVRGSGDGKARVYIDVGHVVNPQFSNALKVAHELYVHVFLFAQHLWWGHGWSPVEERVKQVHKRVNQHR